MSNANTEVQPAIEYPDSMYRGFTQQAIQLDGTIAGSAFDFKEYDNRGVEECSINWGDDDGALLQLAAQTKIDGRRQFKFGACRISRSELDHMRGLVAAIKLDLRYERSPVEENQYHGNLLCKTGAPNASKKALCGMLAMLSDRIYTREELDSMCCPAGLQ